MKARIFSVSICITLGITLFPKAYKALAQENSSNQKCVQQQSVKKLNKQSFDLLERGEYEKATPLAEQALKAARNICPPHTITNYALVSNALNTLASLYDLQGQYDQAKPLYEEAVDYSSTAMGPGHFVNFLAKETTAALYSIFPEGGDLKVFLPTLADALNLEESKINSNLFNGNEYKKRSYLSLFSDSTNTAISTHVKVAPRNPKAQELSLTTIFRRKGRILDVLSKTLDRLKQTDDPVVQEKLYELRRLYAQQSPLFNPQSSDSSKSLSIQNKIDKIEGSLSLVDQRFEYQQKATSIKQIQNKIPSNAALLEFARYQPIESGIGSFNSSEPPRYVVYVLTSGNYGKWADLGSAREIDQLLKKYLAALSNTTQSPQQLENLSNAIYTKLLKPIASSISASDHLIIAPDSQLNLLPFETLINSDRRYLIENHQITYLTSGRDLLRMKTTPKVQASAPLLIASPDYGQSTPTSPQNINAQLSTDLSQLTVTPLDNALPEGQAIAALFPASQTLVGKDATEANLKNKANPKLLHIATHGFFLPDQTKPDAEDERSLSSYENPLLRSGLALAGFNQRQSDGDEDGVLSALEVTGLDLRATQLVTLSACQTGLGAIANGEGVYGLRRAFTLAGAQSQVMSLWNVNDASTKTLMIAYYQRLKNGEGRGEALRNAQLDMLNNKLIGESGESYNHPYYWAAFVRTGDWNPMN